jgi:hypothetical protein
MPNHHAAIHQVDAPFDFPNLAFDLKKGTCIGAYGCYSILTSNLPVEADSR